MRVTLAILVHPCGCDPVTRHYGVAGHLHLGRFECAGLESEALRSLRSDPVSDVVFGDRRGADRRPAEEVRMPKVAIGG